MHPPLAETFDVMLELGRALSLADVHAVLLKRSSAFGVRNVFAALIPKTIVHPSEQHRYVILGHWPEGWVSRYFEKQYVRRDPTIYHASTQYEPLVWSEILYDRIDPRARVIMDEAKEFQLLDGLTIPMLTLDGNRVAISFSGDRIDKSPGVVARLTVLASYAVTKALEIRAAGGAGEVRLSPRERESLLWLAQGMTTAEIGDHLGVSSKAIEKSLANARAKLGAFTSAQALAVALRLGLLQASKR